MVSLFRIGTALLASHGTLAWAMSGSQVITPHNYVILGADALVNNPPSCGYPYASMDITRITAVQAMDKSSGCGKCLKVVNGEDDSKWAYVLAVDTGGKGLDVSTVIYKEIFGQDTDPAPASWSAVDDKHCADIWLDDSSSKDGDSGASGSPTSSPVAPAPAATTGSPATDGSTTNSSSSGGKDDYSPAAVFGGSGSKSPSYLTNPSSVPAAQPASASPTVENDASKVFPKQATMEDINNPANGASATWSRSWTYGPWLVAALPLVLHWV
ncbi:hypothetical protein H4R34_002574 [Dimargaris verticillata]|uniref:RlpA-like double-psi beta-barrel-protein domain-containing protein-containing protein n=1 Tax=Dimargaris verticillata TaxID=2761393 RepID=A0A9W8B1K1_9FUNG|nr:hypothetical protein H4R34_002574 [Dimargaris verticillata]